MTTLDVDPSELSGLGLTATEEVLVLKGTQGPFPRYTLVMPPGVLIRSAKRPDPDEPFPGNRKVEKARAQKFADYLRSNASSQHGWTCPPHQLRAHPRDITFKMWISEHSGLAKVEIPKFRNWDIQDGQHRILGFNLFNDQTELRVGELRRLLSKAERNGDREAASNLKRELAREEAVRKAILEDGIVEVVIVVADDIQHGQMFADIAMHAKGINPDFATFLDQRDPVHRIATNLMVEFTLLNGLVNDGQAGRTPMSSDFLLGVKSLADICHGVIVGPGRVGKRVRDEIEKNESAWAERIEEFLTALFECMPDLQRLQRHEIDAPTLREESLISSATMLRVLAIAWHELLYPDDKTQRKTVNDVKSFLRELEPHLRCFTEVTSVNSKGETVIKIGVPEDHPLWSQTRKFQAGNKAPSARQGDIHDFGKILAAWGRNGLPMPNAGSATEPSTHGV